MCDFPKFTYASGKVSCLIWLQRIQGTEHIKGIV